jgi:DMSO/TMAO reductase YedYZ molybdopterin-dependent catalytic subunit
MAGDPLPLVLCVHSSPEVLVSNVGTADPWRMTRGLEDVSVGSRIAEPDEQISTEELALATRNHGMPLEAMRYDLTPIGLHYLLIHYDIPATDADTWQVTISGRVARPLMLSLAELRRRPWRTVRVTMECAGNGRARLRPRPVSQPWLVEAVGTADWTGTPLRQVLHEAGVDPAAVDVVFTGADHGIERGVEHDYQRGLPLADALSDDVLLAYEMNGSPLPPQHGYPLRLVVPGWYGMAHVKWLRDITVLDKPFTGFQNAVAYRVRHDKDEEGEAVTRIAPRALLVPPGFPDFMSRQRVVRPGDVLVTGRAWSGYAPVVRVEVSTDGGATWSQARLDGNADPAARWAWRGWAFQWCANEGRHVLTARATDADGNSQPHEQAWNRGGFANNAQQLVPVICTSG